MEGRRVENTMAEVAVKLTHGDYLLFPDDGLRHELIDGEHVVTAAPRWRHQLILGDLFVALHAAVRAQGSGAVVFAPMDVILSKHDVLQPDILYISAERRHIAADPEDWVRGAPDLCVEVLSPSSRRIDEVRKRQRYELFGVAELWIADPPVDCVRVYRRESGGEGFARPVELSAEHGDVLTTPLLSAFAMPLQAVFAAPRGTGEDADDWSPYRPRPRR
jgi:Uma2 family endonuclease